MNHLLIIDNDAPTYRAELEKLKMNWSELKLPTIGLAQIVAGLTWLTVVFQERRFSLFLRSEFLSV